MILAAATRPYPGERVSGDGWVVTGSPALPRIALIDALGHGSEAAAVAEQARATLLRHPDLTPVEALHACHRGLSGTRGAAISIACIDERARMLTYVGVGNVEARVLQEAKEKRLIVYRGIVGNAMRTLRAFEVPLCEDWLLLMHTDGVRARFTLAPLTERTQDALQAMVDHVLAEWGREADDATVVALMAT